MLKRLEELVFDNSCIRCLPLDKTKGNFVRLVEGACFSRVDTTSLKNPKLVSVSKPALQLLDLHDGEVQRSDFAEYFCGNKHFKGSFTAAHCYCGHQFGNFAGQLGDGAAVYLGEVINSQGERWEIQLKGAGKTPYSRSADGRKALRSSIREFLCSEHMHGLNIPTSRAGTISTSDTYIERDIFYTGNVIKERSSVVCRIAPSFIRFGSFEIFKSIDSLTQRRGPSEGRMDVLIGLTNLVIKNYYPWLIHNYIKKEVKNTSSTTSEELLKLEEWKEDIAPIQLPKIIYNNFYEEVVFRTAKLVALWQCNGWCHGVLNTDNMSILGITLDYGPFGFMEYFNRNFVPNTSDDKGRYSYQNQPKVCKWNCMKLGEALAFLLDKEMMEKTLSEFDGIYQKHYFSIMSKKLGIINTWNHEKDEPLLQHLLEVMEATGADWTTAFRALNQITFPLEEGALDANVFSVKPLYWETVWKTLQTYLPTVEMMQCLSKVSVPPRLIFMLRHIQQTQPEVCELMGYTEEGLKLLEQKQKEEENWKKKTNEEKQNEDYRLWKQWLEAYTQRVWEDSLYTSQASLISYLHQRNLVMNAHNPKIVLRNHIAQKAIALAETGDYSEVERLASSLARPYDENHPAEDCTPWKKIEEHINVS